MASLDTSSAQIEREIEAQRSRVADTIDEIQEQLSPGQLIDQVMAMTKSGGGDFAKNLGHAISANPLPVALLGASLVWLMSGAGASSGPKHQGRTPSNNAYPSYAPSDVGDGTFEGYRGDQRSPLDRAKAFGEDVAGKVSEVAGEIGGTIGDTVGGFSESAGEIGTAAAGARDQVQRAMHDMRDQAAGAGSAVSHMLENQPLVAGALAFAAGAALGAIVPRLPQEDELMGEAADDLKAAVKEAAAPIVEEGEHLLEEGQARLDEGREALTEGLESARDKIDKAMGNGAHRQA